MRVVVKLFLFILFCVGVWYLDQYLQVTVAAEQARLALHQFDKHGPDQATQWGLLVQNMFWVRFALWTSVVFLGVVGFWSELTGLVKLPNSDEKGAS